MVQLFFTCVVSQTNHTELGVTGAGPTGPGPGPPTKNLIDNKFIYLNQLEEHQCQLWAFE